MAGATSPYVPIQEHLQINGLNVSSLLAGRRNKMKEVKDLINRHKIDIFVLGESWLTGKSRTELLPIDGFTYRRADRATGQKGGGLIVYLRENVSYTVGLKWNQNNVQFFTIYVTKPTVFDLVAIYSPPSSCSEVVISRMRCILRNTRRRGVKVMFIGDLNIDPDRPPDTQAGKTLKNLESEFSARRLIYLETHGHYCIDHIYTDIPEDRMRYGQLNVYDSNISDHKMIGCTVKYDKIPCPRCGERFVNERGMQTHYGKAHAKKKRPIKK